MYSFQPIIRLYPPLHLLNFPFYLRLLHRKPCTGLSYTRHPFRRSSSLLASFPPSAPSTSNLLTLSVCFRATPPETKAASRRWLARFCARARVVGQRRANYARIHNTGSEITRSRSTGSWRGRGIERETPRLALETMQNLTNVTGGYGR